MQLLAIRIDFNKAAGDSESYSSAAWVPTELHVPRIASTEVCCRRCLLAAQSEPVHIWPLGSITRWRRTVCGRAGVQAQAPAHPEATMLATSSSASPRWLHDPTMAAKLSRSSSRGSAALDPPARSAGQAGRGGGQGEAGWSACRHTARLHATAAQPWCLTGRAQGGAVQSEHACRASPAHHARHLRAAHDAPGAPGAAPPPTACVQLVLQVHGIQAPHAGGGLDDQPGQLVGGIPGAGRGSEEGGRRVSG